MIAIRVVPEVVPDIGVPLIFVIGTLARIGTGEKVSLPAIARQGVRDALPVMSILVGVGMFVQIMALTGARGYLAVAALELPRALLYVGMSIIMPAFGSAYAASSVLGIPLVYVFLGTNEVVVAAALSLIAGLADMMPPPLLLCVFAGQLVLVVPNLIKGNRQIRLRQIPLVGHVDVHQYKVLVLHHRRQLGDPDVHIAVRVPGRCLPSGRLSGSRSTLRARGEQERSSHCSRSPPQHAG
jgi:hypothetical protein